MSPLPATSPSEPSLEKSEAGTDEAQLLEEIKVQVPPPTTTPQADPQEFNYDCPDYLKERSAIKLCVYCPEKRHGKHSFCKVHRQGIECAKYSAKTYDKDHGEDGDGDGPTKAEVLSKMSFTELLAVTDNMVNDGCRPPGKGGKLRKWDWAKYIKERRRSTMVDNNIKFAV